MSVVPMDREVVLKDQTVVIRDGRIDAVSAAADVDTRQMRVVDGRGKWLMPALADMHVHLWDPTEANLFLANGVAHVRNMWGTPLHLAWRQKVASGEVAGPRLTTTSPIVDGPGPDGRTIWPGSVLLATPEEAAPLVKRIADRGYDQVKAYSALQPEPLRALGAAAKVRGIPIAGHCPEAVRYEEAIDAGMSCFEHFAAIANGHLRNGEARLPMVPANRLERMRQVAERLDLDQVRGLAERMAREQIWNCPTLVVHRQTTEARADALATPHLEYMRPHTREGWDPRDDFRFRGMPFAWDDLVAAGRGFDEMLRAVVGVLRDEGAPLLLGTDMINPYVIPGFSIHQELAHLRAAGLSPYEVFRTGTSEAARFLGEENDWGTIAAGRRADLLLLSRDPLREVDAVRHVEHLFVNGRDFDRAALDAMLAERLREVSRELDPVTISADDRKWIVTHAGRPFGRMTTLRRPTDRGTLIEEAGANFQWGETRRRATAILDEGGALKEFTATTETGFGTETLSIARTSAGYRAHLTSVDGAVSDTIVDSGPAPLSPRLLVSGSASFVSSPRATALTFEDERLILASVVMSSSPSSADEEEKSVAVSRPGEVLEFVFACNAAGEITRVTQRMALGVREWVVEDLRK